MSTSQNEHPARYIDRVRSTTRYATARTIIGIMFWLSIVAVLLMSGIGAVGALVSAVSRGPEAVIGALGLFVAAAIYLLGVVLARAAAIAYFDAVDVLIEANRAKGDDI